MPYARNALDGNRVYFEDDGGNGAAVVLHGGLVDSVDLVRGSNIAQALQELPTDEFRLIYVAHRGVGRSDKPHEVEAYAMPLRVADAVAVLDELGIERTHFIGNSWGGQTLLRHRRTCSRAGALARDRRPAALHHRSRRPACSRRHGVFGRVAKGREYGALRQDAGVVRAGTRFPDMLRERWLDNDPAAIEAAWSAAIAEGAISEDLGAWHVRCLIHVAAGDVDFHDQAQQAANEIPNAEFISVEEPDQVGTHLAQVDAVLPAVLRTLRGSGC